MAERVQLVQLLDLPSGRCADWPSLVVDFRLIYEFGHWSEEGGRSGHGSSLRGSASDSAFMTDFLLRFGVTSLLDAGCGAMVWQPGMLLNFTSRHELGHSLTYHGADIVQGAPPGLLRARVLAASLSLRFLPV